jgi:TolB protein
MPLSMDNPDAPRVLLDAEVILSGPRVVCSRCGPTVSVSGVSRLADVFTYSAMLREQEPIGGEIVFVSERDDASGEVYVMNADGTGVVRLTNDWHFDLYPARVAFTRMPYQTGNLDVYVMNADGTNVTRLTTTAASDWDASWSPDGSKIAFVSERDDSFGEVYLMNADGTAVTRLTSNAGAFDNAPSWSPDGSRIAFVSSAGGSEDIYVVNVDGSGLTNLTNDSNSDGAPAWSPDGSMIAFVKYLSYWEGAHIFLMRADGSGVRQLTADLGNPGRVTWSGDGSRIAFDAELYGIKDVFVMNADGSGITNLTLDPVPADRHPSWRR